MNRNTFVALSAAAVALAACGHKTDTTTSTDMTTNSDMMTTNMMAANDDAMNATAPMPGASQAFVNTAAASDAFEVASSKLALDMSKSSSIKAFADKMITAHTASTDKLKTLTAGMTPPLTPDPTLNADQQQKLDALKTKTGTDFDTAYAAAQVDGHQVTLDALKAYAATGDTPQLKDFASDLVPTVTAHLNMAQGLKP